ncbi:hypothetical protein [Streptomyces sp. NPDC090057]|uniref:hypothetical protein n=1 Tax=Streptomyces sp. NPDC090057 TaxID=3365935 RepID=UPI00382708CE
MTTSCTAPPPVTLLLHGKGSPDLEEIRPPPTPVLRTASQLADTELRTVADAVTR